MTREEEIEKASKEFAYNVSSIRPELNADSFRQGAKWADKTMIDKACEWLSQSYTSGVLDWKNCDSIIENFKKTMEE